MKGILIHQTHYANYILTKNVHKANSIMGVAPTKNSCWSGFQQDETHSRIQDIVLYMHFDQREVQTLPGKCQWKAQFTYHELYTIVSITDK